jgi:hypothetical protein
MVLALAMCETCPPSEVEVMISVLLNLFDARPSLMNLLKLMIDREIAHTGISFTLTSLQDNTDPISQRMKPGYFRAIPLVQDFCPPSLRSTATIISEV